MKAISAPRTGLDAADRAERGLGPFATLAARSSFASLPAQGGEGGKWSGAQLLCWSLPAPPQSA